MICSGGWRGYMNKLIRAFGFRRDKVWYYRDLALSTTAAIATLWAIVCLGFGSGRFDLKVGVASFAVALTCCALSPNWPVISAVAIGFATVQGWFAVAFSNDERSLLIAIPATIIELLLFWLLRNRTIRKNGAGRATDVHVSN